MHVDNLGYLDQLVAQLWSYAADRYGHDLSWLEQSEPTGTRPPVFRRERAAENIVLPEGTDEGTADLIRQEIPERARHRWFRSMKSSQALTQSVFGALKHLGALEALHGLEDDDGQVLIPVGARFDVSLEYEVETMDEPRPTSVDVWIEGDLRVAIEAKLTETDIGRCSRPRLDESDQGYCNGSYTRQLGRGTRCSLSELGIAYWDLIPGVLRWDPSVDLDPCPLYSTYQLVRNLLASQLTESQSKVPASAALLFDNRNPAFQPGGPGWEAWQAVQRDLIRRDLLRRISWQRLFGHLKNDPRLRGLLVELGDKYGLVSLPVSTST